LRQLLPDRLVSVLRKLARPLTRAPRRVPGAP
jgi:hypothetical protein